MKKQNSGKALIIAIFIILALAIAGGVYYYIKTTTPKNVFVNKINGLMDTSKSQNVKDITKFNTTVSLSGNIETTNKEVAEIANIINNGKIKLNIQSDMNNTLVNADLDYKNEKLLQAKALYKSGDSNVYIFVQDLFDKYFKVNTNTTLNNNLEVKSDELELVNQTKAQSIIKEIITKILKEDYFYKENVDGMTKNTMKLSIAEIVEVYNSFITELKDNQEYLNCYKNPEKVKEMFENTQKSVKEAIDTYNKEIDSDKTILEISLYTKGFSKEAEKIEFKVKTPESEEAKITINKVDKYTYGFSFEYKTEKDGVNVTAEAFKGTVKFEKKDNETVNINLVIDNVPDVGKVTLNMELKNSENVNIEDVNTSNSVDINTMKTEDLFKLYTNLTKMKIYPYIAPYLGL